MEKVKLKFYNIDRCGYYKYNDETAHLTNVADMLDNLKQWIEDKTLQQTETTGFLSAGSERLPVYCANVTKNPHGNTYLLVTWNRSESTGGNISSIHKDQPISNVADNLESTPLPDDHIPGYATYFWIIPEDNILATIRFNHILNGHVGMNYYLKGFLTRFSKYTKLEETDERGVYEVKGYSRNTEEPDNSIHPYFNSTLKKLEGKVDYIKSKRNEITKIIRKTTISPEITEEKDFINSIFKNLGIQDEISNDESLNMKYEMKIDLDRQELDDIIDTWRENHEGNWDDIGFKIKSENNPLWLSSDIPSEEVDLDVTRTNDEFLDFNRLLIDLESRLNLFRRIYTGQ